jgi:mannose-1-phosphate guanylyltransferase
MAKPNFYPVILAGGRGTRFWPLSRRRRAKQVLSLDGNGSMIQQTVERLSTLAPEKHFWVITNEDLRDVIADQLNGLPGEQIMAEPEGRNTAPAIGLAAFILIAKDPDAVIGMFPSDHVIGNQKKFLKLVEKAVALAAAGENIVVLGIKPTRPETGYGYIEVGEKVSSGVMRVRRFTEKPNAERAQEFLDAGNYLWNSGMFVWSARTLAQALREHFSESAPYLEEIAASFGTRKFESTFRSLYPKCENISVDYAVLEPRSAKGEHAANLFCLEADIGWNDLGSWAALYEHHADKHAGKNIIEGASSFELNAQGNYVHAPKKFVAVIGIKDVVVVDTEDALLITSRDHAQDVGKVVKHLDEKKLAKLV